MNGEKIRRLIAIAGGSRSLTRTTARLLTALLLGMGCAAGKITCAQSCNPAVVSYMMRDENGRLLNEAQLNSVRELLPEKVGDAAVLVGDVEFAADGKTFYWPESSDHPKGETLPALEFVNNGTCTMHLAEVTLVYNRKKMRLVFNIEIAFKQQDRRPVVDSLPFQEGTFVLDLSGWSHEPEEKIPSSHWKKAQGPSSITRQRRLWLDYDLALWDRFLVDDKSASKSELDLEIAETSRVTLVKRLIL
jgi:hypothetical protein